MSRKKYKIFDGDTMLASDINSLDLVFCFIKGFVDTYYNHILNISIVEMTDEDQHLYAN